MSISDRASYRRALQCLLAADLMALGWLVATPGGYGECSTDGFSLTKVFCLNDSLQLLGNFLLLVPTALLMMLLHPRLSSARLALWMLALTCFIELLQRVIPGRYSDWRDVGANALGAWFAILIISGWRRLRPTGPAGR